MKNIRRLSAILPLLLVLFALVAFVPQNANADENVVKPVFMAPKEIPYGDYPIPLRIFVPETAKPVDIDLNLTIKNGAFFDAGYPGGSPGTTAVINCEWGSDGCIIHWWGTIPANTKGWMKSHVDSATTLGKFYLGELTGTVNGKEITPQKRNITLTKGENPPQIKKAWITDAKGWKPGETRAVNLIMTSKTLGRFWIYKTKNNCGLTNVPDEQFSGGQVTYGRFLYYPYVPEDSTATKCTFRFFARWYDGNKSQDLEVLVKFKVTQP